MEIALSGGMLIAIALIPDATMALRPSGHIREPLI